jgi:inosine-uridine nucleoside N-ribohydrolase
LGLNRRSFLFFTGAAAISSTVLQSSQAAGLLTGTLEGKTPGQKSSAPVRLIIDADPGVDDAVSILMALKSREVQVEAVTVVAGNVESDFGTRNALTILEVAGRSDIPVSLGATRPLMRKQLTARPYHGTNGLGDVPLPAPKAKLVSGHASDHIISKVKSNPGQITILCIGPLTNVALALMKDPSIGPQIAELAFMGGTILSNGNVTPVSTFNIYADPEAARIVVNSGIPKIAMVGTDVTTKVKFSGADFDQLDKTGSPAAHLAAELGRFRLRRASQSNAANQAQPPTVGFNDLPTTAALIGRDLFTMEPMNVDIEVKGELTSGMTVANRRNSLVRISPEGDHLGITGSDPVTPNVNVCTGIDEQGVHRLFLDRVGAA